MPGSISSYLLSSNSPEVYSAIHPFGVSALKLLLSMNMLALYQDLEPIFYFYMPLIFNIPLLFSTLFNVCLFKFYLLFSALLYPDKKGFFVVYTSSKGPQIYELTAPSIEDQKK